MTAEWGGKRVAFVGSLAALPRRLAARELQAQGGLPRRGISRRTDMLVVGRGAVPMLADGRLAARLEAARRAGAAIVGEARFLQLLGLRPPPESTVREMDSDALAARSGLAPEEIQLLSTFGLLDEVDGRFGFRALVTAREAARLIAEDVALERLIATLIGLGDDALARDLITRRQVAATDTGLARITHGEATELDGQRRLPLKGGDHSMGADELFEAAEAAEAMGDVVAAASLYDRCSRVDPGDPSAAFNLGNLRRDAGLLAEAERAFLAALSADAGFAEAWYNLADIRRRQGRIAAAARDLEAAMAADPGFADAYYNRAELAWATRDLAVAAHFWRRYLAFDDDSPWARRARRGLAVCQHADGA